MSVRASVIATVVLSFGITCSAQIAATIDSSRYGMQPNSINTPLNTSITGTVRSADERGIRDVRVEVRTPSGETVVAGYTDAAGAFHINQVPAGYYELVAVKGLNEGRERVQVAGMETDVTIHLPVHTAAPDGSSSVSVAQFKVPDKARKLYEKGKEALQKSKLEDAKKYAEKALEVYPHFAEALTLRGILRMNDGQTADGMGDFDAAIKADPSYALAYTTMGAALNHAQKYQEASRTLLRAVSLQPSAWQAYYELAKSSLGEGDYKTALKQISKACEISQEYAPVHLVKAHALLGMKMYQDAIGELELYLTREPSGESADAARKTLTMAKSFVAVAAK